MGDSLYWLYCEIFEETTGCGNGNVRYIARGGKFRQNLSHSYEVGSQDDVKRKEACNSLVQDLLKQGWQFEGHGSLYDQLPKGYHWWNLRFKCQINTPPSEYYI